MRSPEERARRLLRWYPRLWRQSHEEEFAALLEDSIAERPHSPRRFLDVALHGVRLRSVEMRRAFRTSRRRALVGSGATLAVVVGAIAFATGGFGLVATSSPSKGGMPYEPGKSADYSSIPDYVAVWIGPNKVGYTPKAYVAVANGSSGNSPMGLPARVYSSNLKTLLGHEYPGIGFVALGASPWTQPCRTETVTEVGTSGQATTNSIPCPSTTIVLPNMVGMVTPTGVGELSGLGVSVVVQNVHSRSISPGHIVSTSPGAGSTVHARQAVVVDISIR